MWYFGYISPRRFVRHLARQLKKVRPNLPRARIGCKNDVYSLSIPVQEDSEQLIRVRATSVDLASGLLVEVCLVEKVMTHNGARPSVKLCGVLHSEIVHPRAGRQMRSLMRKVINEVAYHIDSVNGMQLVDFLQHSFVDDGEASP